MLKYVNLNNKHRESTSYNLLSCFCFLFVAVDINVLNEFQPAQSDNGRWISWPILKSEGPKKGLLGCLSGFRLVGHVRAPCIL